MQAFQYNKANDLNDAVAAGNATGVKFVAGGTTLIDLMKLNVEQPTTLVDINHLLLDKIDTAGELLSRGSGVRGAW